MSPTLATVKHILRKELLVPVSQLRLHQTLTSSAGLSPFEWNVLLYHLEEKYNVQLSTVNATATVQELLAFVQPSQK